MYIYIYIIHIPAVCWNSILDLAGLLDPPLFNTIMLLVRLQLPVFVQITLLTYL